jgi:hypothetical protein
MIVEACESAERGLIVVDRRESADPCESPGRVEESAMAPVDLGDHGRDIAAWRPYN